MPVVATGRLPARAPALSLSLTLVVVASSRRTSVSIWSAAGMPVFTRVPLDRLGRRGDLARADTVAHGCRRLIGPRKGIEDGCKLVGRDADAGVFRRDRQNART
jgi:hypothetical protein